MKRILQASTIAASALCALLAVSPALSADKPQVTAGQAREQLRKEVPATIADFKKADAGIEKFFAQSAGYVVFPRIGKVGLIVAGGDGIGEVYEKGKVVGTAVLSFGTIGLQAGAQEFREVIFFQDSAALERFKQNKFEFTANASAVIVKAGAAAASNYRDGVVVFTQSRGGAMFEAALGGQKFKFSPEAGGAK
jgi:lipid-binding SYLF domain-containing protein